MRKRARGQYFYARNSQPIVWTTKVPTRINQVYCIGWGNSQHQLMASKIINKV